MISNKNWSPNKKLWVNLIIRVSVIILVYYVGWKLFSITFGKNMCDDITTCYSIAIFLTCVIITIKIRILEEPNKNVDFILFNIGTALNILFLIIGFYYDCISDEDSAILLLNGLIWFDIMIAIENIIIISKIYREKQFGIKKKTKKSADLFEQYLSKEDELIKRALTDRSYKNIDHSLKDENTNFELATYGDAVIKMCYSEILFDKVENLTEKKKNYESDEFLVTKVAKHYQLIDKIRKDSSDSNIPLDYVYEDKKQKNKKHKYIATAVEAMIGAIYKDTHNLKPIIELLRSWMNF